MKRYSNGAERFTTTHVANRGGSLGTPDCKRCPGACGTGWRSARDARPVGSPPTGVRGRRRWPPGPSPIALFLATGLAWQAILPAVVAAQDRAGEGRVGRAEVKSAADPPPPLSLESLYHPESKFDYAKEGPQTHWVGRESPTLIVRRESTWMTVDLATGQETPWPVVERLRENLQRLEGVGEGPARSAAMRLAGELETPDQVGLARIGQTLAVVSAEMPAQRLTHDATRWENPTLDPTGRWLAYTMAGDLYLRDWAGGNSLRLTDDGSETLLNGLLDWMYQEEIFGRGNYRGFWFSHDGNWLAMLRIDIGDIEPYVLSSAASDRGTGLVRRYSKPGDPIPQASLWLWDLRSAAEGRIPPPRELERSTAARERIITGVWWQPDRPRLFYTVSDRRQTWRELKAMRAVPAGTALSGGIASAGIALSGDGDPTEVPAAGGPVEILREESPAWIEPPTPPRFLDDGSFVWRSEVASGRYRLDRVRDDGAVVMPLTPDDFDVDGHFVAADGSFALVTGDADGVTVGRHVYRIDFEPATSAPGRRPVPARLTSADGWHEADISPDGLAIVVRHSTPTQPRRVSVIGTFGADERSGVSPGGPAIRDGALVLGEPQLRVPGGMREPEFFRIETPDGKRLPAMLVRPSPGGQTPGGDDRDGDGSETAGGIPVVVEVYGGPGAAIVTRRWSGTRGLYREYLARRGIATLVVDNRSSAGRGPADTWAVRHRVGELELRDLLVASGWLRQQAWVDADRVALRGWSFGGFLTLLGMTRSDHFAAGIAGGSVTDWREYDAFYTERYMGLPDDNPDGYRDTAPIATAGDLHGRLLLIHGELDDNVHPSNTMRMVDALQRAGQTFDLMIYPGAAHGIHAPHQVWHMAKMTDAFLWRHLGGDGSP